MGFAASKKGKTTVLSLSGRLDAATAPELERRIGELFSQGEKSLLVDLGQVEYISSAGLRLVLLSLQRADAAQARLGYIGLKGQVEEVFKVSGFLSMIRVFATEAEALAQL